MTRGHPLECLDVTGIAIKVDDQNGGGVLGYLPLDVEGIHVPRFLVAVRKYRPQTVPQHGVACGKECKTRDDNLAREAERAQDHHQPAGATGNGHAVLHLESLGDRGFQMPDPAGVGERAVRVSRLVVLHGVPQRWQQGPTKAKSFLEKGATPVYRGYIRQGWITD